jgi:hypothetical protein
VDKAPEFPWNLFAFPPPLFVQFIRLSAFYRSQRIKPDAFARRQRGFYPVFNSSNHTNISASEPIFIAVRGGLKGRQNQRFKRVPASGEAHERDQKH